MSKYPWLDTMVCAQLLNVFEPKDPQVVGIENFYDSK